MKHAFLLLAIAVPVIALLSFAFKNDVDSHQLPDPDPQVERVLNDVDETFVEHESTLHSDGQRVCGEVQANHDYSAIPGAEILVHNQNILVGEPVTTNEVGHFCVAFDHEYSHVRLTAKAAGYESDGVLWDRQSPGDVQILLSIYSGLQLLVRDLATGLPIDSVSVDIESSAGESQTMPHRAGKFPMDSVKTVSGLVTLPALPLNYWKFSIGSQGYGTETVILNLSDIDLSVPYPINLRRRAALAGIVYDRTTGFPIEGARVGYSSNPEPDKFGRPFADVSTVTTSDGLFSFDDVKIGVGRLFVSAKDYAPVNRVHDTVSYGFIQVALGFDTKISGAVYRADGVTTTTGRITITNTDNGARTTLQSDERGRFVLGRMTPGEYIVMADTLHGQTDQCEVSIAVDSASVECDLVVRPNGAMLHIELTSIDPGKLDGSALELWAGDQIMRKVALPSETTFTLGGVDSGSSIIKILLADGATVEQEVVVGDEMEHYLTIDMN